MKNNALAFICGAIFGGIALAVAGLALCEYSEGLPDDKSDESQDYAD